MHRVGKSGGGTVPTEAEPPDLAFPPPSPASRVPATPKASLPLKPAPKIEEIELSLSLAPDDGWFQVRLSSVGQSLLSEIPSMEWEKFDDGVIMISEHVLEFFLTMNR